MLILRLVAPDFLHNCASEAVKAYQTQNVSVLFHRRRNMNV